MLGFECGGHSETFAVVEEGKEDATASGVGLRVDQAECMPLFCDAMHSRASVLRPLIYVLWMATLDFALTFDGIE